MVMSAYSVEKMLPWALLIEDTDGMWIVMGLSVEFSTEIMSSCTSIVEGLNGAAHSRACDDGITYQIVFLV